MANSAAYECQLNLAKSRVTETAQLLEAVDVRYGSIAQPIPLAR